jgi:hypothetical protein
LEYGGDWFLKYKSEEEMLELAGGIYDALDVTLSKDTSGVYQYLEIRKE